MENVKVYNEEMLKNLNLRDIAIGKKQGPITGYPSMDRLWLKYFSEDAIKSNFEPKSMYQLMRDCVSQKPDDVTMEYFGIPFTNKDRLNLIDDTAKALKQLGVNKGDIVIMSLPNIPEVSHLMYALNKIGAVVHSVSPLKTPKLIKEDINDSKAKYIFAIDQLYPAIAAIENETCLEKIITVSAFSSIPDVVRKMKNIEVKSDIIPYGEKYIDWLDFLDEGKKYKGDIEEVFDENSVATIVHTGGSTGIPKGVVATNEQYNALIYQHLYSEMGFEDGMSVLGIVPSFHALGLNNLFHLASCLNLKLDLVPKFTTEEIPKLVLEKKPNILLVGPVQVKAMLDSDLLKNADLSFIKIICSGGEALGEELQKRCQKFLEERGSSTKVWIGYGATETSAGTTCMRNNCFKYGSIGAPYLNNVIGVFDPDNQDENIELGYGEIGEIRVKGPTVVNGYFGSKKDETDLVIKEHDGDKWYHSGDLGYFDEDGLLYVTGRMKRIITRRENRIYPSYIEKIISIHPAIKECAVVGVSDEVERLVPVANIVLNEGYDESSYNDIMAFADDAIKEHVGEYAVPAGYNFIEQLPLTLYGKLDFKKLEQLGFMGKTKEEAKQRILK